VSLCPLLPSTVCPLSVSTSQFAVCPLSLSTSHCTVCWFCVTRSTAFFFSLSTVCQYLTLYSLSTLCQYLTMYCLLVLCHCVHCCLLQSVHCLSGPHTLESVGSVSLCPLLSSTVCPLSVSTSHFTVCWFCVAISAAVFYSLSTVCQYVTFHLLTVVRLLITLLQ